MPKGSMQGEVGTKTLGTSPKRSQIVSSKPSTFMSKFNLSCISLCQWCLLSSCFCVYYTWSSKERCAVSLHWVWKLTFKSGLIVVLFLRSHLSENFEIIFNDKSIKLNWNMKFCQKEVTITNDAKNSIFKMLWKIERFCISFLWWQTCPHVSYNYVFFVLIMKQWALDGGGGGGGE